MKMYYDLIITQLRIFLSEEGSDLHFKISNKINVNENFRDLPMFLLLTGINPHLSDANAMVTQIIVQ